MDAQTYAADPPGNESSTCDWIILPLLYASGYLRRDILSRVADSIGQIPDYTGLSSELPATWYQEAKAWSLPLQDVHAKQALNYANQNGKRFVALTNGQVWRLYDNAIRRDVFESSHRTRWFLNDSPVHRRADLRQRFNPITRNGNTVYLDADRPGTVFVHDLCALCTAMGIAPSEFSVTLSG